MSRSHDEAFWHSKRGEVCLDPEETYLNAGSYSPVPKSVMAAAQAWRGRLAASPMRTLVEHVPAGLWNARRDLAEYLSADPNRLLLLPNATAAVNVASRSLELDVGSEVLITDHEYGAMRFCWERIAEERRWSVQVVEIPYRSEDPNEIVATIERAIGPRTRILFFSHVTSPTGLVLPAAAICQQARDKGILTVIDGAHAPGMIPLNLDELDADYYAGNCHKWMMSPTGAGFLHVSERVRRTLQPLVTSWGWEFPVTDDSDSGWGGSRWSQRIEFQGTQDRTAQLVLPEVIRFRRSIGDEAVWERTRELATYLRQRMSEIGFDASTPLNPGLSGSMTAFETAAIDPILGREWWWTARISIPFTRAAGRTFLRVSTAWFNTTEEIDRLVELVPRVPINELRSG